MKQIYIADDPADAHLVAGILDQYGISCDVRGEDLWSARGQLPLTTDTLPTVWIADDGKYEQAAELVKKFKDGTLAADKGGSPWTCPKCSEEVEAQFSNCWNCGANRPLETETTEGIGEL